MGPVISPGLAVPLVGAVVETGDPWEPYRLLDAAGAVVIPVAEYQGS